MRIKCFTAPDMRTALRMVRDEQGPDAVILSTRTSTDGAIEVVAATDYDEALVAQALRAAVPAIDDASARASRDSRVGPRAQAQVGAGVAAPAPPATPPAAVTAPAAVEPAPAVPRDSLMSRARAVFKIDDGPTLAELTSSAAPAPKAPPPAPNRFDAMMAALDASPRTGSVASAGPAAGSGRTVSPAFAPPSPPATTFTIDVPKPVAAAVPEVDAMPAPAATPPAIAPVAAAGTASAPVSRPLQAVAMPESDPAIAAMREEMARMRQMMEAQMDQLSLERLRGSPARAAVLEALARYGCEESLAQAVAERIDPRLPVDEVQAPMLAELARMLTVAHSEPLDDGGVIALVGPTGAGKTTTAAKLAARFAARHRARDVALVTTDCERAGAREQLQAHGRRLGITVCEAEGPERLQDALAQLVDYPLVLVDTTGHAPRDRAVFSQILWLRAARKVRSLLVLPANAHPHDLGEVVRRYRPAKPEGVVLTKLDESGRLGSALSVLVRHGLQLAYTTHGQEVPSDLDAADPARLVQLLEKTRRAADNPLATEDRHAVA